MKKLFFSVFAVAVISLSVTAQDSTTVNKKQDAKSLKAAYRGDKKEKREKMKELNLSEDQKKELKANREDYKTQVNAINNDKSLTDAQRNEKIASLKKEMKSKSENVFSPEQKAKLDSNKMQQKHEAKQDAAKRMDDMKTKLGLSDDQMAKLKAQAKINHSKMKTIRDDASLDAAAKKQKLDDLRKSSQEERKTFLTPNQQKQYEEMKSAQQGGKGRKS